MTTTNDHKAMGFAAAQLVDQLTRNGGRDAELVHDGARWTLYTHDGTDRSSGWSLLSRVDTVAAELLANHWISKAGDPRSPAAGQRYQVNAAGTTARDNRRTRTETPS